MNLIAVYLVLGFSATVNSLNVSDLSSKSLQDVFFERASSKIPNIPIPNKCQMQLLYLSKNWKTLSLFPMIDSWGKIPTGLMMGHLHALGNFYECINFNTELPTPLGQLRGQYCRANIPLNPRNDDILETNSLINRLDQTRQNRVLQLKLRVGICIPKTCSEKDIESLLPFKVTSCKAKDKTPFETLDYVTITVSSIIAFLMLLGTTYDYLYKGPKKSPYLLAFSIPTNAEKLFHFSVNKQKNNIDCLNGIRVLSMIWVMYGHSFASYIAVPKINFTDYIKWSQTLFSMFTDNAYISVDSFFFLSGLLLSWVGMKEIEKRKGRINVPLMYLHRYLRLTPMVAYIMLFAMSLLKFFGNGPLFDDYLRRSHENCEVNWWRNLLYIQNYDSSRTCIIQTWYLAIDFQLFLFSPLILYGFYRWGKKCYVAAAILIALSVGCIFGILYKYGVTGPLLITDKNPGDRMGHYYLKTHTRYSIWLIGMCFGYFLHEYKDKNVKIPWYIQVLGWIATGGIIYGVILAPHTSIHGLDKNDSTFAAAMYESFSKIGWGLMMSWVIFACYHGYGGVVNSFLSNPFWQPFARLSFTMYLSHLLVMTVIDGNTQTSAHFSDFNSILVFWSHLGLSILVSIALVLAIESPLIVLEKTLLSSKNEKKPEAQTINEVNSATNEHSKSGLSSVEKDGKEIV